MERLSIEELIDINKKIPRRLVWNKNPTISLINSKEILVDPRYCGTGLLPLRPEEIFDNQNNDPTLFSFNYNNKEKILTIDEAKLVLGYDFSLSDNEQDNITRTKSLRDGYDFRKAEIASMLAACDNKYTGNGYFNAYSLGFYVQTNEPKIEVIYFRMDPFMQADLANNPLDKNVKDLVERIKRDRGHQ